MSAGTRGGQHAAGDGRIDARIDARYAELSPQERRVADFLLEHLGDLAVFSAADISRGTGVSKATVSRLFRKLGFADFREVRDHTRAMRSRGLPVASPARTGASAAPAALEVHARQEQANHQRLLDLLADGRLETALELMTGARNLLVVGLRNSYPVALHLHQQLIQVRAGVRLAPQPGQTLGEEFAGVGKDDVLVLVGFRRRPALFGRLMAAAAASQADVILVADGTARGYAAAAACWLECPVDSAGAFDSYSTAMALVGLLANGVLNRQVATGRRRISAIAAAYEELAELEEG
jgi:DNA-binding MurR/RpiR family transcriptional regulator